MPALIIDYGMGNIASAKRALEQCGSNVIVSEDPRAITEADRIIIPGVGAFPKAMKRLSERGWSDAIRSAANDQMPVLGICLGMQLLATSGTEFGDSLGLDLISGKISKMEPSNDSERIPHVGWNEVTTRADHPLLEGISDGSDFYFVHSYRFLPVNDDTIIATTPYCGTTVSAVASGNVMGVQFHPEKSSRAGFHLLRNFLEM